MRPLIVFDLDGTLIESRFDLANSANEMLATYGAPPLPVNDIAAMVGDGARVLVERALTAAGLRHDEPHAFTRFLEIYDRRLLESTHLYEGVGDVLANVDGRASLAVLTNKPKAPTSKILDAFGITSHFQWIVGGDAGFPRKPDPGSLRHLMNEAQVTAARTLFVGDSMIDVETARRAGVQACIVLYGFGRARGNLELAAGDLRAEDAVTLGRAIDRWLGAFEVKGC